MERNFPSYNSLNAKQDLKQESSQIIKPRGIGLGSITKATETMVRPPMDPFSHAHFLIYGIKRTVKPDADFASLEDPNTLLGFIENDKMIQLNQNSILFLENFKSMASKDPGMFGDLFAWLYHSWRFQIRFTANKSGIERRLQHSFPGQGFQGEGFGRNAQKEEEKRLKEEARKQEKYGPLSGEMSQYG